MLGEAYACLLSRVRPTMENVKKTFPWTNLWLQFDHPRQVSTSSEHMYVSSGSARFNQQSFFLSYSTTVFRSFFFAITARHSVLGNLIVHLHLISTQTQPKAPSISTIRNSYRIMTSFSSTRHSFAESVWRWCEKTAFSRSHDNCSAHVYFFFVSNSTKP